VGSASIESAPDGKIELILEALHLLTTAATRHGLFEGLAASYPTRHTAGIDANSVNAAILWPSWEQAADQALFAVSMGDFRGSQPSRMTKHRRARYAESMQLLLGVHAHPVRKFDFAEAHHASTRTSPDLPKSHASSLAHREAIHEMRDTTQTIRGRVCDRARGERPSGPSPEYPSSPGTVRCRSTEARVPSTKRSCSPTTPSAEVRPSSAVILDEDADLSRPGHRSRDALEREENGTLLTGVCWESRDSTGWRFPSV